MPRSCSGADYGSHSFNWYLASTFASAVGRSAYHFACAWILVVSGHGVSAVAVFFTSLSMAELIASPLAGWISDHCDRRLLCLIADFVRFLTALALGAIMIGSDLHWAIWLSTIPFAACDRIALTASQSMIPSVGAGLRLSTANCIVCFLTQSGSLVAAALTGVLLHVSTQTFALAAIASAFAISVCCMCLVRREPLSTQDTGDTTESELLVDNHLLRLGAIYALLYLGGMLVSVIGPSFVLEELGGSAIDYGQLESAWSAGSILGAILLMPLVRAIDIPILHLVVLALTAFSFAVLKMLDLPWALLAFATLGALYNLGRVAVEVTLQSSIPRATLGRAKGALHCTGVFLGLILFAIGAAFSDEVRPSTIFLVFAGILALSLIVLIVSRIDWYQKG
ncbi:MFS transporter (plasmid) [Phyllobacterium sp. A18/5-2]|uniref:MFS transporter n=1 Tax=Phyllobacterium sp. A18/5-2 TaxID=2978392 RepID=UPI0021C7FBF2|nr:MFS transporter [Phyllobacterium sp. A18/5-2]UXN66211.1 MFS transporter [Phyllobacterium sp. A18/5-2]